MEAARTIRPENPTSEFDIAAERAAQWLELIADRGEVIELRAPKCQGSRKPITRSGFFDYGHLYEAARRGLIINRKAPGVYFTLNPVKRDLLARRCNRDDVSEKGTLATDADIVRRRWMLVDIDPLRPAEVSSTDTEKSLAREVVLQVRDFLNKSGWPEPILADSGNGFHLLYRIDLATDDGETVKNCLRALAHKFNSPAVHVDTSVFNPSRIVKLYGSTSRKGDSTAERPHRLSELIEIPDLILTVPDSRLSALAATAPKEEKATAAPSAMPAVAGNREKFLKRVLSYVEKIPPAISGQGGHRQAMYVACILVQRLCLTRDEALPIFETWNTTCQPPWSASEIDHKLREAEKETPRGELLEKWEQEDKEAKEQRKKKRESNKSEPGEWDGLFVALGERDPDTEKLVLNPRRTLPGANDYDLRRLY